MGRIFAEKISRGPPACEARERSVWAFGEAGLVMETSLARLLIFRHKLSLCRPLLAPMTVADVAMIGACFRRSTRRRSASALSSAEEPRRFVEAQRQLASFHQRH